MKVTIAVDPGKSGGYAVNWGYASGAPLGEQPQGIKVYKAGSDTDFIEQVESIKSYALEEGHEIDAVIELVGGYAGGDGHPGSRMFTFGDSFGFYRGVIMTSKIPLREIRPQEWQKIVGAGNRKSHKSKSAWKRHLVNLAKKHFPQVQGINLHTADALLILEAHLK